MLRGGDEGSSLKLKKIHIDHQYDNVYRVYSDLRESQLLNIDGISCVKSDTGQTLKISIDKRYNQDAILSEVKKTAGETKEITDDSNQDYGIWPVLIILGIIFVFLFLMLVL